MILVFVGIPLVVFLSLALLPRGAPAAIGIAVALAAAGVGWLLAGGGETGAYPRILISSATIGVGMAALAQGGRLFIREGAGAVYGALMLGIVALALAAGNLALGG